MIPKSLLRAFTAALTVLLASCAHQPLFSSHRLPELMSKRLGWMDDVACTKRLRSLPITDAKREADLLQAMSKLGESHGLPHEATRFFFIGQMNAAKLYQEEWMQLHPRTQPVRTPRDLATVVRPALDELGKEMIHELARERKQTDHAHLLKNARDYLVSAMFSSNVIAAAMKGLEDGLK